MNTRVQLYVSIGSAIVPALLLTWDAVTIVRLLVFTALYTAPLAWLLYEGLATYVNHTKPAWETILIRGLVTILAWTAVAITQQLLSSPTVARCNTTDTSYMQLHTHLLTRECRNFSACPDTSPWWYTKDCAQP